MPTDLRKKYFAVAHPARWKCEKCSHDNVPTDFKSAGTCSGCGERSRTWSQLDVHVMRRNPEGVEEKIGEYQRNYSTLYETFFPFAQGDKEYALISHMYTGTCVIELPSCKHVCGECEWKNHGFCPTGFYVPSVEGDPEDRDDDEPDPVQGRFGFVCGCVWGDDSSWKIEFLDLSKLSEGKFDRSARFGYVELPGSASDLWKSIRVYGPHDEEKTRWTIRITATEDFPLTMGSGKFEDNKGLPDLAKLSDERAADFIKRIGSMHEKDSVTTESEVRDSLRAQLLSDYEELRKILTR